MWGGFRRARAFLPRRLLVQSRTQQKSFLFFLEEKIRRAQKKNCKGKFLRGCRRSVSGGGRRGESIRFYSEPPRAPCVRQSGFCSKKVRILSKRYRQLGNEVIGSPATRARQPFFGEISSRFEFSIKFEPTFLRNARICGLSPCDKRILAWLLNNSSFFVCIVI